jgi:hypothetical protein
MVSSVQKPGTRCSRRSPEPARAFVAAAALAAAVAAAAAEPRALACGEAAADRIQDPLGRDGLAAVECPLPDGKGSVLIVSDDTISWPVIVRSDGRTSLEEALLGDIALLGPGQPYFQPGEGAVLYAEGPPGRLLVRFSSSDPVTLAPQTRWLVVALDPVVLGAADTPEAAAALEP